MTGPLGNREFCFSRISMFPSDLSDSRETKFTKCLLFRSGDQEKKIYDSEQVLGD